MNKTSNNFFDTNKRCKIFHEGINWNVNSSLGKDQFVYFNLLISGTESPKDEKINVF